ncbi:unnamed protein product, partial [Meganyctiphanes norvegica]
MTKYISFNFCQQYLKRKWVSTGLLCLSLLCVTTISRTHISNAIVKERSDQLEVENASSGRANFEELLAGRGPLYLAPDHPQLIQYVRQNVLVPPSQLPYNLTHPDKDSSPEGQTKRALKIVNNMSGGFFVEAGAVDGEHYSNTLGLELHNDWSGLLVEPNPKSFAKLLHKHRKAWAANACLSPYQYPAKIPFKPAIRKDMEIPESSGKVYKYKIKEEDDIEVQCFPLQSLLLALNQTTVDYLSLDVEGSELDVITTLPLQDLNIKVFSIEYLYIPGGKEAVVQYMNCKGYIYHSSIYLDVFMI